MYLIRIKYTGIQVKLYVNESNTFKIDILNEKRNMKL